VAVAPVVVDLPSDLARPEGRAVDIRIGPTSADRVNQLFELPGGDALPVDGQ
jgi:hypothetical protein